MNHFKKLIFWILGFLILVGSAFGSRVHSEPAAVGTIAYVRGDGDEIRLIEPDGSGDRPLWAHGLADPYEQYAVWNLAWKPDGRELAFASTHENWCSLNASDIFAIDLSIRVVRRVTQAPACGDLARYPTGTVRVPVKNNSFNTFTGFLYFQGAPILQPVSLPPGGSAVITFNDVADFGQEVQLATVIVGRYRNYNVGTAVDVKAGGTVTTATFNLYNPDFSWEARSVSWRADSGRIGYAYGFNALFGITPNPTPLDFGARVVNASSGMPNIVSLMAYGPKGTRAGQILYDGYEPGVSEGIYLVAEGSTSAGQPLVTFDYTDLVRGLAWLPDGSGFVYSVLEGDFFGPDRSANIFRYEFAGQKVTRLTSFVGEFTGQLTVSPNGQQIAFERSAAQDDSQPTDIWLMNRDGSGKVLLVEDGYAPAWSPGALPALPIPRAYLPLLVAE